MDRLVGTIRLEWAAAAAAILAIYAFRGDSWLLFLVLILAPDFSMLGYLAGPRIGALVYNLFHVTFWAIGLLLAGATLGNALLVQLGMIWLAHVAMDRALGFGLKLPSGFKDTHLGRIGAASSG